MQDSFRRSALTIPVTMLLGVANAVATVIAKHKFRIANAQLCLSDPGTGAGSTTVRVNVGGVAIVADTDLTMTVASAKVEVDKDITKGSNYYPGGALVNVGDAITVDVLAVPGTNVPKAAFVVLDVVQVDV